MKLTVREAKRRCDVGKGTARIHPNIMKDLGVAEGDALRLEGKKISCAKVFSAHPRDIGLEIIQIDGFIRKNCGIVLNETINVAKIEVKNATSITFSANGY